MTQRSDAGEARTRGPLVSSQALYHWTTGLPTTVMYPSTKGFRQNLIQFAARISLDKELKDQSSMRLPTMWYVRPAKPQISLRKAQIDQNLC